ncbi:DUF2119 domain-containing protein [Methanobrevibacter sp. DSM 116169]|uniref:DUF2119 domain-containing protein n=1 Tax=Methanobrevibacter sp. DSM 116169 TaxID=3242727 RepID=UPI0038FBEE63
MSYYHYINNGKGPKKLFIGGLHGNEGNTSFYFLKNLKKEDFSKGQIYIFNFDKSDYISTLNKKYYTSAIGKKILHLIEKIQPDFYTELHCYDVKHFEKLTSPKRFDDEGIPPLIDIGEYVLVSSVSPYIRINYLKRETVCKTLEIPCFNKLNKNIDIDKSIQKYNEFFKLIKLSNSRKEFDSKMRNKYHTQYDLAIKYTKKIFGENFLPF